MVRKTQQEKLDEAFDDIANAVVSEAEGVICEFEQFVEGLRHIRSVLNDRLVMAEDELRKRDD